jgi:hypothetical protein
MAAGGSEKAGGVAALAEGTATAGIPAELSALVATEVVRQVGALRAELALPRSTPFASDLRTALNL